MDIIVGRYVRDTFVTKEVVQRNKREFDNDYFGDECINQAIKPIWDKSTGINFSSFYLFKRKELDKFQFNLLYFVNREWLEYNRNNIFNHSFNNDPEFEDWVKRINFPSVEKSIMTKEKNYFFTSLDVPFNNIDRIIVQRNYEGYERTVKYIRKFVQHTGEKPLLVESPARNNGLIPKGVEFILK